MRLLTEGGVRGTVDTNIHVDLLSQSHRQTSKLRERGREGGREGRRGREGGGEGGKNPWTQPP